MADAPFPTLATLQTGTGPVSYHRLGALEEAGLGRVAELPYVVRILLEAAVRNHDGFGVTEEHIRLLAAWSPEQQNRAEVPYAPARVLLQDFTGVPSVVDLAALRAAMARLGGNPERINPRVPVDLVVDHSVQVDVWGSPMALQRNAEIEFDRNLERYQFLRWGQQAFRNFRVVPPATGIVHQVNLEYLAQVVMTGLQADGSLLAWPDTLVGTDSHTTMVNGLGVLGWGVGGIEAEAAMLGQPSYMLLPVVVGVKLTGRLPTGATATDLVLTVTQRLREHGVVGKLVEFFGDGVRALSLADRATIANMAPEYGATCGFFPVDGETLAYLRQSGRPEALVELVEAYSKANQLWCEGNEEQPRYTETLEIDVGAVVPSLAGPRRPQDRVPLAQSQAAFRGALARTYGRGDGEGPTRLVNLDGEDVVMADGAVVIAAITSCTNTSNPSVLVGAGLLAKKAVDRGLRSRAWVKTSLAPGSRVVTAYLERSGLLPYLEQLRFHVVGYGCTTCIGNSGPLHEALVKMIEESGMVVAAVLSGNRNFEGRISPQVKANYLASPPLVVAYALAGTMDIDLDRDPLGHDEEGRAVYLSDVWPTSEEIREVIAESISPDLFTREYATVFDANEDWNRIEGVSGGLYAFNADSTYVQEPPFFVGLSPVEPERPEVGELRVLALLGDSVTTDHISPAGNIAAGSPAARYLEAHGVARHDFNSYGARRGNHEVMMRGTFANIRLKNLLAAGTEGGVTTYLPTGDIMSIYDAAMRYQADGTSLVVLAGAEYGTGSSRDWAAKGTFLLGVKAVIAKSFERIHRSNLAFMGVLPLQFLPGQGWQELGLTGREGLHLELTGAVSPLQHLEVRAVRDDGTELRFSVLVRLDSPVEVRYWRNGGILHTVLRDMLRA